MAKTTAGETFIESKIGELDVTVDTAHVISTGESIYNLVTDSGDGFYFGVGGAAYPLTAGGAEYVKQ